MNDLRIVVDHLTVSVLTILPTNLPNIDVFSRYGDHYEWNKVVTCIHNVLSQQRYLEHYGEVTIRNLKSNDCTCKITFVKVNKIFRFYLNTWHWQLDVVCFLWLHRVFPDKVLFCCSLVIGVQTQTRMRCRAWCWTKVEVLFTGLEACGMKASSVTLCRLQNVSGSQVSPWTWSFSTGSTKMITADNC